MPWKETNVIEERLKFVNAAIEGDWPFSDLCRAHGISRKTGYKFLQRYEKYGLSGLEDRSRARLNQDRIPEEIIDLIIDERIKHPTWGPRKIIRFLEKTHTSIIDWPAISTAGEILKKHGLVRSRKRRHKATPTASTELAEGTKPNEVWCADFKGWFKTQDGHRCDPLTISDYYSRFVLCCRCAHVVKALKMLSPYLEGSLNAMACQSLFVLITAPLLQQKVLLV